MHDHFTDGFDAVAVGQPPGVSHSRQSGPAAANDGAGRFLEHAGDQVVMLGLLAAPDSTQLLLLPCPAADLQERLDGRQSVSSAGWRRPSCCAAASTFHQPPGHFLHPATASSATAGSALEQFGEPAWRAWRRSGSRLPCRAAAVLLRGPSSCRRAG